MIVAADVKRLHLEPGDLVIIRTPADLGDDEADELQALGREAFPNHVVLFLAAGFEIATMPIDVVREVLTAIEERARSGAAP